MNGRPLRIAHVGPVATSIPPPRSSSVELITSLLTEGLVARGHAVTLFAPGSSRTAGSLHATFPHGYTEDDTMWPWEAYEMVNLAAAIERAHDFDIIHYQARYWPMSLPFTRLARVPVLQTLHHAPEPSEMRLWSHYPEAPFVAISDEQARRLAGLNVVATVRHGIDIATFTFTARPDDYLVFLGRFTEGKGVLQAIDVARRAGMRLRLAAEENDYYRAVVAPHVDGDRVAYVGEVDHAGKVALLGGARALLYPIRAGEPFGLVMVEAMACGTPVAALDPGAVRELVDEDITGKVFRSIDALIEGLPQVLALDRARVRARAAQRFSVDRMVDEYVDVYRRLIADRHAHEASVPHGEAPDRADLTSLRPAFTKVTAGCGGPPELQRRRKVRPYEDSTPTQERRATAANRRRGGPLGPPGSRRPR